MSYILTASGIKIDPLHPEPEQINIHDIAHSLVKICRFNGHCHGFYSVAEHSIRVSREVPIAHKLTALLHDATEAYIGDMVSPIKRRMAPYRKMEENLWRCIAEKFELPEKIPHAVNHADLVLLATEKRDLMPPDDREWPMLNGVEPTKEVLRRVATWDYDFELWRDSFTQEFVKLTNCTTI